MRFAAQRPGSSRRGLTLIEMLVTVALLILIMTIVVQIFQSATGAMSASRAYQELDQGLRRLDSTIRQDLNGVTARLTPPLDPKDNLGYFEYGENAFADAQGEDADDYVRFTTKAPAGYPFTGRVWIPGANGPTLITSQHAEVIYFLRNGNLYRRVFLIAPERQSSLGIGTVGSYGGYTAFNGLAVSWQGMNDLSARPVPTGVGAGVIDRAIPILNTLGDLTNRENRAFSPRFANDFRTLPGFAPPDGIPDDADRIVSSGATVGNGVPDWYPTLYRAAPSPFGGIALLNEPAAGGVTFPARTPTYNKMAFPYIYPGAYSRPDPQSVNSVQGWIHSLEPAPNPTGPIPNQAPLESGDSLPAPGGRQTCWMFPTWRETMDPDWTDPVEKVNTEFTGLQSPGLQPFNPAAFPAPTSPNFLPRVATQPFGNPDAGRNSAFNINSIAVWEEDLIMTGVRSFDIKAYDNSFSGYVDLGWGDDVRLSGGTTDYLTQTPPTTTFNSSTYNTLQQTYAHEGRIPPLGNHATFTDRRIDPQAAEYGMTIDIGDPRPDVIRLRRVWDSWSTDYTHAPGSGHNPLTKQPTGLPFAKPIYPSYPPPYPMPLRGIQIQVRVVDPRNERIKVLTIRQDFSDKL